MVWVQAELLECSESQYRQFQMAEIRKCLLILVIFNIFHCNYNLVQAMFLWTSPRAQGKQIVNYIVDAKRH